MNTTFSSYKPPIDSSNLTSLNLGSPPIQLKDMLTHFYYQVGNVDTVGLPAWSPLPIVDIQMAYGDPSNPSKGPCAPSSRSKPKPKPKAKESATLSSLSYQIDLYQECQNSEYDQLYTAIDWMSEVKFIEQNLKTNPDCIDLPANVDPNYFTNNKTKCVQPAPGVSIYKQCLHNKDPNNIICVNGDTVCEVVYYYLFLR